MRLVYLILLLLAPSVALADPVTGAIATWLSVSTATASFILQAGILIATTAYGQYQKKRAAEKAKDAYNASLEDRTITTVTEDASHTYIYGRTRVGSAVVAIFTTGDKDQYKHLVCIHAAHECDGIEDVWIAGKKPSEYGKTKTSTTIETFSGTSHVLAHTPTAISRVYAGSGEDSEDVVYTFSGSTITLAESGSNVKVRYTYSDTTAGVTVRHHLGAPDDPVDAVLNGLLPEKWPATATLRGFCYSIVTLDLNESTFQSGIPSIEVLLRGKKLYDMRTGMKAWSQNNALAIYDYLTSEMCGVDAADLPVDRYITAANVCDETFGFGKRYTINGTVTSEEDKAAALERMAQSMAGCIVATTWDVVAGKYIAPIMALDQSDIIGSLSITPGISDADLYNGVKGQFVGAETKWVATDMTPYSNASFVSADGRELWTDIQFSLTDTIQRIHNLSRIFVEDQRNGYAIKAEFSLKTWKLRVGDRITMTSAFFGWENKVFRITGKKFSPMSAVELTMKEDDPSIWDFADAVAPVIGGDSGLTDPHTMPNVTGLTAVADDSTLLQLVDGTIIPRILAKWDVVPVSNAHVELQWAEQGTDAWSNATSEETSIYLAPVQDGVTYAVRARVVSDVTGAISDWSYVFVQVGGKTTAPDNVLQFTARGGMFCIHLSWAYPPEPDIAKIEIYSGPAADFIYAAPLVDVAYPSTSVTHNDLDLGQPVYYWARLVNTSGIAGAWVKTHARAEDSIKAIIDALEGSITESQLYADLRTKIDLITAGKDVIGSVNERLALLEELNDITLSAVKSMSAARTVGATSEAERIDALIATTQTGILAEIARVQKVLADEDQALASDVSQMTAQINDPATGLSKTRADILTEQKARAAALSAVALQITTLQSTVEGSTASVRQLMESIDGLEARVEFKTDVNGHVGGMVIGNNGQLIKAIFAVDEFAIASATGEEAAPFMWLTVPTTINGITYPAGQYSRNAFIGALAVDTLQIAGNAITANSYFNNDNAVSFGQSQVDVVSGSLWMPSNPSPSIAIYRCVFSGSGSGNAFAHLYLNGSYVGFMGSSDAVSGYNPNLVGVMLFQPVAGVNTLTVKIVNGYNSTQMNARENKLIVMGAKR